jgi:hypothetical protein
MLVLALGQSLAGGGQASGKGAAGRLGSGAMSGALGRTLSTVVDVRGAQLEELATSMMQCACSG